MTTDHYAVVGHPIGHSQSPRIHGLFAEQTGEAIDYTAIEAPLDDFAGTVRRFFEDGGQGLNVTVPFKEAAWQLADERTDRAELAGAVNTLYRTEQGRLVGDNTDGDGLVRDLTHNEDTEISGQRVLILGAGGAVRGVLLPLLQAGPAEIMIANRTAEKATGLAHQFDELGPVSGGGYDELHEEFDLIINGTSASLAGDLPPVSPDVLTETTVTYDMMYGADRTAFSQWAVEHGVKRTMDGLGMLVEQAAESFRIWRGVRPETAPVIAALRESV